MSTATASAPLASKVKAENVNIVLPVETVRPDKPTDPVPAGSIQDVLNSLPAATSVNPVEAVPGEFQAVVNQLGALIATQVSSLLTYYIARGHLVWRGIDIKLSRSTDKTTRAANRASAIKALTMMAEMTVDSACEPTPRLDVWLYIASLDREFSNVDKLPSVKVARQLATMLTRVDPPVSWDSPETYVLKKMFNRTDAQDLINRAGLEKMTLADVTAAMEQIAGRVMADAPVEKATDATANADAMVKRIMDAILEKEVNPFRFVETLQSTLVSYGYALAPGHDDRGVSTYKLVRHGRTEAPTVEQPF